MKHVNVYIENDIVEINRFLPLYSLVNSNGKLIVRKDQKMLNINEFAHLCGCSVYTLRYYDKICLLKPSIICNHSHYRFYDEKQVLDYNKIKEFQEIGFSIEDIKRFNQTNHIEKVTIINQKVDDLEEKLEKALTLKEKYDE